MASSPSTLSGSSERTEGITSRFTGDSTRTLRREYNLTGSSRRKRMHEIFAVIRHQHLLRDDLTPVTFRRMLEELGPTFVKVGQILSMRSEILPQSFCNELAKLRTHAEPMSFETVTATLEEEYGRPAREVFSYIDPQPLGSASLAQVHHARLTDGREVAIKVQRPHVQETMAQDIDIIRSIARQLTRFMKKQARIIDINMVVEELWVSFREETDFMAEARNLLEFRQLNAGCAFIDCPEPCLSLCTEHVVVMEYVDGISISQPERLVEAGYDLEEIGSKLVDNYATQVLDDGYFHADPHPGNIMVRAGKIVYIDLGMMGRLSAYNRRCMSDIIAAVGEASSPKLKEALLRFAVSKDLTAIDHAAFLADLDLIVAQFGSVSLQDLDLGSLLFSLIALARNNQVEMPPAITMMARGLVTLEGVLDEFLPRTNMIEIIKAHIARQEAPDKRAGREARTLVMKGHRAIHSMLDAAGNMGELTHMLTRGQLKMNMEMKASDSLMDKLSHITDRLSVSIVIAGLYIGSSIVYYAGIQPVILGIPVLGAIGYLCAAILSVYIVVDIIRHGLR